MRTFASRLCLVGLLLASGIAQAEDDAAKETSRALLKQGNESLDKENFQPALEKFQQAYERFPSAKIFFSQGQALRGLDRNADALRAFQRFLDDAKGVSPEHQAEARKQVAELTARVGQVAVRSNQIGALVRLNGQEIGTTPLPAAVFVDPGQHSVEVEWQSLSKTESVTVAVGNTTAVQLDLETKPGLLSIRCNREGALVRVDQKEQGATPLANFLQLAVGTHSLTLEWQGEKKTIDFTVGESETLAKTFTFEDKQPAVAPVPSAITSVQQTTPAQHSMSRSTWLWIGAGTVVAVVGTSLALIYGRGDRYPSTAFGSQTIGRGP
jgi:hypothetical protein